MICLKISTFVVSTTTASIVWSIGGWLWFAWKYLPLWYQQQQVFKITFDTIVVICLKISTFVVSTTALAEMYYFYRQLWFAWKYLPLWYQQQREMPPIFLLHCCDLLENIYLCGINNSSRRKLLSLYSVVICLKISTFVVSTTA